MTAAAGSGRLSVAITEMRMQCFYISNVLSRRILRLSVHLHTLCIPFLWYMSLWLYGLSYISRLQTIGDSLSSIT
jgi:hypothetical protein